MELHHATLAHHNLLDLARPALHDFSVVFQEMNGTDKDSACYRLTLVDYSLHILNGLSLLRGEVNGHFNIMSQHCMLA